MTTQENNDDRIALLQGTLDLLILKTLVLGPCHGQGVARLIQRQSEEVFFVDHGSLYLALHLPSAWEFASYTANDQTQQITKTVYADSECQTGFTDANGAIVSIVDIKFCIWPA